MKNNKCNKTFLEGQYCEHIPDYLKLRLYAMEEFTKYDTGKPKLSLLPSGSIEGILEVIAFGARKYEKDNWKKCNTISSYYDAAYRHLTQFWSGENVDSESGLSHIDHAMCNLIFLKWLTENKESADDRPSRKDNAESKEEGREEKISLIRKWTALFRD